MKARFSDSQIVELLQEKERFEGTVAEFCRQKEISAQTFYAWKRKFHGTDVTATKRLRDLEKENAILQKLLAEKEIALRIAKDFLEKKR
jgi:putative transposase